MEGRKETRSTEQKIQELWKKFKHFVYVSLGAESKQENRARDIFVERIAKMSSNYWQKTNYRFKKLREPQRG